jgi:hypothetical protein
LPSRMYAAAVGSNFADSQRDTAIDDMSNFSAKSLCVNFRERRRDTILRDHSGGGGGNLRTI